MTQEEIGARIIEVATQFVGLHETKANAEWDNPVTAGKDQAAVDLWNALTDSGWMMGWPYCAAFVEACWRAAYVGLQAPDELQSRIGQKLTPSVMQSFKNWKAEISLDPTRGAIFFMQMRQGATGHTGIVVQPFRDQFSTIEGNTSPQAGTPDADREGDGVFKKIRRLDFTPRAGLWLRGFLNPIPWQDDEGAAMVT